MVSGVHKHAGLSQVSFRKGTFGGLDTIAGEFEVSSPSRVCTYVWSMHFMLLCPMLGMAVVP